MLAQTEKWTFGSKHPSAYIASRAIMRGIARVGLPGSYVCDIAIDINHLYDDPSITRFVFVWRALGTNLITCPERLTVERAVFGNQCHWFTYDENRLDGKYDEEPDLLPCTYEEALAFLTPADPFAAVEFAPND